MPASDSMDNNISFI